MKCPKCGANNPSERAFCSKCGAALSVECTSCGKNIPADSTFCGFCGAPVVALDDSHPEHLSEERLKELAEFVENIPVISEEEYKALTSDNPLHLISFPNAIKRGFAKYAVFSGRATRREFWWWYLLIFSLYFLTGWFVDTELGSIGPLLVLIIMGIPNLAVTTRRLHDVGSSGWWVLLVYVPIIGLIYFLFSLTEDGNKGPNKYGPDPLNREPDNGSDKEVVLKDA